MTAHGDNTATDSSIFYAVTPRWDDVLADRKSCFKWNRTDQGPQHSATILDSSNMIELSATHINPYHASVVEVEDEESYTHMAQLDKGKARAMENINASPQASSSREIYQSRSHLLELHVRDLEALGSTIMSAPQHAQSPTILAPPPLISLGERLANPSPLFSSSGANYPVVTENTRNISRSGSAPTVLPQPTIPSSPHGTSEMGRLQDNLTT